MYRGIIFTLLLLTGCSPTIAVKMDYLSKENLASYRVGTPDPRINHPNVGERLIVQWSLPKQYEKYHQINMVITLRYRNNEEAFIQFPLKKRCGTYVYDLINDQYYSTQGILASKVAIFGDGEILDTWRHQLWAELIEFEALD